MARKRSTRSTNSKASSNAAAPPARGPVRYAVVGLGHIAQIAVLPAFAHARKNSRLVALVSDDPEKIRKIGRKYRVDLTASYDQYDQLLESGEVDAVYIALPNHLHAEYSIRAAEHGVHVLCEKPMAVTEEECRRMIEARDRNNIKMMIAYRLHFEKANLKAVEIAQSGKLGRLRYFNSSFSFNVKPDNIRTEAEMGGGPMYDIGVYCINAARYLFRQEPMEVCAMSATRPGDERFEEIHETVSAIMRFPNERLATFVVSFGSAPVAFYSIAGDKGELCVDNAYEYAEPMTHYLTVKGRTSERTFRRSDQFAPELLYFSKCILEERNPEPSAEEGLNDVKIVQAILESAQQGGQPVALAGLEAEPAPRTEQEIRRRKVREPSLVNVEGASEEE